MSPDQFALFRTEMRRAINEILVGNGTPGLRQIAKDLYGDAKTKTPGVVADVKEIKSLLAAIKNIGIGILIGISLLAGERLGLAKYLLGL